MRFTNGRIGIRKLTDEEIKERGITARLKGNIVCVPKGYDIIEGEIVECIYPEKDKEKPVRVTVKSAEPGKVFDFIEGLDKKKKFIEKLDKGELGGNKMDISCKKIDKGIACDGKEFTIGQYISFSHKEEPRVNKLATAERKIKTQILYFDDDMMPITKDIYNEFVESTGHREKGPLLHRRKLTEEDIIALVKG